METNEPYREGEEWRAMNRRIPTPEGLAQFPFDEEEFGNGVCEIDRTGWLQLSDFIHELEEIAGIADEHDTPVYIVNAEH